jgi:hypothetical protein
MEQLPLRLELSWLDSLLCRPSSSQPLSSLLCTISTPPYLTGETAGLSDKLLQALVLALFIALLIALPVLLIGLREPTVEPTVEE